MGDAEIDLAHLGHLIGEQTDKVAAQMKAMEGKSGANVLDMFKMQLSMNKLSQLTEMSAALSSAMNSAIQTPARNIKQ